MEMTQLRKEDLSLYRYIKDTALRNFIEKDEQVSLQIMEHLTCAGSYVYQAMSNTLPSPNDRGRGWVFFDCPSYDKNGECQYSNSTCVPEFVTVQGRDLDTSVSGCLYSDGSYYTTESGITNCSGTMVFGGNKCVGTPEQSNRVEVYDENFVVISGTEYMIDYKDGRVIFDNNKVIPRYIDYYWNYVSVVDEWAAIEAAEPPVVVVDMHGTDKEGYQLGAGKKIQRKVDIHVFASNPSERNDLVETIYDSLYLKSAPIYNFPTGDVLDYDGTFYGRKKTSNKLTSLFNRTSLDDLGVTHGNMTFSKVSARHINLPLVMSRSTNEVILSDLNAYRSRISFEIETYTRK